MTFYVENETEVTYDFDVDDVIGSVMDAVLTMENCPYEAQINVLITDNEGIRTFNREYRDIDKETDVLSFPNVDFETEVYRIHPPIPLLPFPFVRMPVESLP